MPISEAGKKADEILISAMRSDRTVQEMFASLSRERLNELIRLLEAVKSEGPMEDDTCSACGYRHGDGCYHFNRRMLMLERARQVRDGVWLSRLPS